ncbi:hypothetical protein ACET3Z_024260 [Daucus carota]
MITDTAPSIRPLSKLGIFAANYGFPIYLSQSVNRRQLPMRNTKVRLKVPDSKLSTSQVPLRARDNSKNSYEPPLTAKQSGAPSIVYSKRVENDILTSLDRREKQSLSVSKKPEKWMLPNQSEESLSQLNLAIVICYASVLVGHVDFGKSTLSRRGHLLMLGPWMKALKSVKGITMINAVAYFDTKKYHVVLLDSPGHKNFIPNMIYGETQADAAVLVIDALPGSFEVGIDSTGGQTREHAQLIRSFGVDQLIVAINYMDSVEYSNDRFNMNRQQLGTFRRFCDLKDSYLNWISIKCNRKPEFGYFSFNVCLSSWSR